MRVPAIIATGTTITLFLAACSAPSPRATVPDRDLQLIEPPASEAKTVSDLEAGRPETRKLPEARKTPSRSRAVEPERAPPLPAPIPRAVAAIEEPELKLEVVASTESPGTLVEIPLPAPRGPGPRDEGSAPARGTDEGAGRGPTILIRGGIGSGFDDCKIHGMGGLGSGASGGIAINRVAPPLRNAGPGPGPSRSFQGGIRIR